MQVDRDNFGVKRTYELESSCMSFAEIYDYYWLISMKILFIVDHKSRSPVAHILQSAEVQCAV